VFGDKRVGSETLLETEVFNEHRAWAIAVAIQWPGQSEVSKMGWMRVEKDRFYFEKKLRLPGPASILRTI
jgi:hypothetical protein